MCLFWLQESTLRNSLKEVYWKEEVLIPDRKVRTVIKMDNPPKEHQILGKKNLKFCSSEVVVSCIKVDCKNSNMQKEEGNEKLKS